MAYSIKESEECAPAEDAYLKKNDVFALLWIAGASPESITRDGSFDEKFWIDTSITIPVLRDSGHWRAFPA